MDSLDKTNQQIQPHLEKIEYYLAENLKSQVPLITEVNRHILLSGGKRLRALLFVLCSRLCGRLEEKTYYFSTIFEYLHAASLLHDDVIDNADLRRGRPSANALWGNSLSILVGDFLLAKAFAMSLETQSLDFLLTISQTAELMSEGMVVELAHTGDLNLSEGTYQEIVTNKTAVLLSAACKTGAILGKASSDHQEALARFGLDLGKAFQLVDDLLDYTSTPDQFGKPVGNDFKEGKITLPLIHTWTNCSEEERNQIKALTQKQRLGPRAFRFLLGLVERKGGLDYARKEAVKAMEKAKTYLTGFEPSETRQLLLDLAEFVVRRTK